MDAEGAGDDERGQGRLQRWSRRKLEARQSSADTNSSEPNAASQGLDEELAMAAGSGVAPASPALSDAEAEASKPPLPDLEALDASSDYSGFMDREVAADLRRAALRKLFALPSFGLRDGLDDYDSDFTKFEGLGGIVTHEMKRVAAREAQRVADALTDDDAMPSDALAQAERGETVADADADAPPAGSAVQQPATAVAEAGGEDAAAEPASVVIDNPDLQPTRDIT